MSSVVFTPGSSLAVSVTATASAAVAVPGSGLVGRVANTGTKTAYVAFGDSTVVAQVPDVDGNLNATPVLAGTVAYFSIGLNIPTNGGGYFSAICGGTDTTSLVVTRGEGRGL